MTKRLTTEEFIERAKAIHGDKYDYSLVEYKADKNKVKIICKHCGRIFEQTPSKHLSGSQCSFLCYRNSHPTIITFEDFEKEANKIHGDNYCYDEKSFYNRKNNRNKIKIYCKFCNNWFYKDMYHFLNGQGCLCQRNIKRIKTCINKYNAESYTQTEEFKKKFKSTCLRKYNVPHHTQNKDIYNKVIKTNISKYGAKFYICTEEGQLKSKQTCMEKYGVLYTGQIPESREAAWKTKKEHNTVNTSKTEQQIKNLLIEKFKIVEYQYKSEKYPFACDFYIPALDLYIEYQGHQSHGKEPFDKNNSKHIEILNEWKKRAKMKEERFSKFKTQYRTYINVWTIRDPLKRKTAKDNGLNWLEFFTMDEFMKWYSLI